ncbi:MAG: OmpA family protein [Flavobacteriales bacterium]|nr:OmpA family protein [Flavobacteriales bacterium]
MVKSTSLFFACIISIAGIAQKNLVPNGGFDAPGKKIKAGGQIDLAEGWESPHDLKADLFSTAAKSDAYGAPDNVYGRETPELGENYAGIMVYSYKNAKPRTYLQTQLSSPLEKDRVYCVKFWYSMADLAKYSCNNIGLHLSKEKLTSNVIDKNEIKPQIMHSQNKQLDQQYVFEAVCRTYIAEGGEQYITIGNFVDPKATKAVKMKRPSGFSKPQTTIGYYYIDDVSVIPMDSIREDECICERGASRSMAVIYNENISLEHRLEDRHVLEFTQLHFDSKSSELHEDSKADLDKVAVIMKEETEFKIEIQGHTDEIEKTKAAATLSEERAKIAMQYLIAIGISADRLSAKGYASNQLDNREGTIGGQENSFR